MVGRGKRRSVFISSLVSLMILATGCTSGAGKQASKEELSKNNSAATQETKSTKELVFYTVTKLKPEELSAVLKPFEEKNQVKIKPVQIESNKFVENFMAAHNAKQPIDVVELNGQDVRFFASTGIIKDLSTLISFKDRFREAALKPYTFGDKIYGLPTGAMSTSALYYNKKMFEKNGLTPPKTYEDVVKIGGALKKDGVSAIGFGGGTIYMWPMWFFQAFAQTSGNQSVERTFATLRGQAKFTDPDYVAAMKTMQKFGKDNLFQPGVNGVDTNGGLAVFSNGKSAMFYGGSWEFGGFSKAEEQNKDKFEIGVVPFPMISDKASKSQATGGSGSSLGIYSGITPNSEDLAKKFLDYYTSDEVNKQIMNATRGVFSVNKNVKGEYQHPVITELQDKFLPDTVTFLDWYWPPEITKAFQQNIQAVVGGQKEPDQAMADIQKTYDDLVAKGYKFDK